MTPLLGPDSGMPRHLHWLRILVYPNLPGIWAARSLEHDIAVEGNTREAALNWILTIVFAHIDFDRRHGRQPLSTFPEAPARYWQAFAEAEPLRTVRCDRDGRPDEGGRGILIAFTDKRPLVGGYPVALPLPCFPHADETSGAGRRRPLSMN